MGTLERVRTATTTVAVLLSLTLSAVSSAQQPYRRKSLGKAETIPLRVTNGLDQETVTLAEWGNQPLVLYVFDGRCSDCREHLIYLQRFKQQHAAARSVPVVAVEVLYERDKTSPSTEPDLRDLISVVDVDGKLWTELLALDAVDSPPGARAKAERVLPLTLFVGQWAVRYRGSSRQPIEQYVRRRAMLLTQIWYGRGPQQAELDVEDEARLRFPDWTPGPTRAEPRRGSAGP